MMRYMQLYIYMYSFMKTTQVSGGFFVVTNQAPILFPEKLFHLSVRFEKFGRQDKSLSDWQVSHPSKKGNNPQWWVILGIFK